MTETRPAPDPAMPAHGLTRGAWMNRLGEIGSAHGFFHRLGDRHLALHVEDGNTLLVAFDCAERVYAASPDGMPDGFDLVRQREWSYLGLLSVGGGRFHEAEIYAFFDRLFDEDVFESFERVIFLGLGPFSGHAAAAFSAATPGGRVLACRPAARLDPDADLAPGVRPSDRFADAAALLMASTHATLLFDPSEPGGAENAAGFAGRRITSVTVPRSAPRLEALIRSHGLITPLCEALAGHGLTAQRTRQILRPALRADSDRLMALAEAAAARGLPRRAATIARTALDITGEARFEALAAAGAAAPPPAAPLPA